MEWPKLVLSVLLGSVLLGRIGACSTIPPARSPFAGPAGTALLLAPVAAPGATDDPTPPERGGVEDDDASKVTAAQFSYYLGRQLVARFGKLRSSEGARVEAAYLAKGILDGLGLAREDQDEEALRAAVTDLRKAFLAHNPALADGSVDSDAILASYACGLSAGVLMVPIRSYFDISGLMDGILDQQAGLKMALPPEALRRLESVFQEGAAE